MIVNASRSYCSSMHRGGLVWSVFLSLFLGLCFSLLTHRYPSQDDYAACVPATEEPNHRGRDPSALFRRGLLPSSYAS